MRTFVETDRLVLLPFTPADADHLVALDNDPDVMRFINGGRRTSREAIRARALPRLLHDYPCIGTRGYLGRPGEGHRHLSRLVRIPAARRRQPRRG